MRRLFTFLMAMLWASGAQGVPSNAIEDPHWNSTGYTLTYNADTGDMVAGTYVVGLSFPQARIGVERGSTFEGTLHACDTKTFAAATCDVITTLGADITNVIFGTARTWYVIVVDTAETAGSKTTVRIRGSFEQITEEGAPLTTINFGTNRAQDYFTPAIQTCPTMVVTFFEATTVEVHLYATDPSDDTVVEIEAATLLAEFSATTASQLVIRPATQELRFIVVDDESSGVSVAKVFCLDQVTTLDEPIMHSVVIGHASLDIDTYGYATGCMPMHTGSAAFGGRWQSGLSACDASTQHTQFGRDLVITRARWMGSTDAGEDVDTNAQEGVNGCSFQMLTAPLAASGTALGPEFFYPASQATGVVAMNEVREFIFPNGGVPLAAGEHLGLRVRNGEFCEDGVGVANCTCDATFGYAVFELYGYYP